MSIPLPDREAISQVGNPRGLDGIEFRQYSTAKPQGQPLTNCSRFVRRLRPYPALPQRAKE